MAPPLKGIHLNNFRNFTQRQESFSNSHTLFKGRNAVGKTNLLEAISFLCPGTGFRKDTISNFSNQDQKESNVIINYDFDHEELSNHLKIELTFQEERWSKQYFLNDKKIQQQQLLQIFQLFWFTETDKVFFIKVSKYLWKEIDTKKDYISAKKINLKILKYEKKNSNNISNYSS